MEETQIRHCTINNMDIESTLMHSGSIWVFGYGSLTWKPDFNYAQKETGYIRGFKRRFWQGNSTHRGTKDRIARVATLIKSTKKSKVWGVAFEIKGKEAMTKALGGLTKREITLGGYEVVKTSFHPRDKLSESKPVVLYIATQDNDLYLGEAPMDTMAREIVLANGDAGSNIEYVTRLADYIRNNIPEDRDSHLFELDRRVRELSQFHTDIAQTVYEDGSHIISDFECDKCDIIDDVDEKSDRSKDLDLGDSVDSFNRSHLFSDMISVLDISIINMALKDSDIDHKHRMLH